MPLLRMAVGAAIAFGLDRLSKILVVHWLDLASVGVIDVRPPYLVFRMVWNKGINFGFFSGYDGRWVLVLLALVVSLLLMVWMRNKRGWLLPLAAGAVVGGAMGNALDRVMYGAVADFINMSCCGIDNPSSFNIADAFIFLGAFVLIIGSRRNARTQPRTNP
jgi:signal peptidase II